MYHRLSTPISLQAPFASPELFKPQISFTLPPSSSPIIFLNPSLGSPIPVAKTTRSASSALPSSNFNPVLVNSLMTESFFKPIFPSMINWLAPTSAGKTRFRGKGWGFETELEGANQSSTLQRDGTRAMGIQHRRAHLLT